MPGKRVKSPASLSEVTSNSRKKKKLLRANKTNDSSGVQDGLMWLLGKDISVQKFRNSVFEKKHLHISRKDPDYYSQEFAGLATPEDLFKLVEQGIVPAYRLNMFRCMDGSTKETPSVPPRSAAEVRKLFKDGWSIQWLQPQQEHDTLASLVSKLESEFGSLVGVNAYLTPPAVQGLAPHWDDVEVFVMQLAGRKSWSLHASTEAVELPAAAQTLPRYSSGDLPRESLSPIMAQPQLCPGDLLYFPRGVIHHAPNKDKGLASVHLTISTYQRQSLYDLTSKTFEEAMAKFWESDEMLRRGLPWCALSCGASAVQASLSKAVASQLRRVAANLEEEAAAAPTEGCVSVAMAEMAQEFVKARMPPRSAASDAMSLSVISPEHCVVVPDPSALTLQSLPGTPGAQRLVHCLSNARRNHMMNHPPTPDKDQDEEEEEEEEAHEEEEEVDAEDEEEEEGEEDEDEDEKEGQLVNQDCADVLRNLCAKHSGTDDAGPEKLASVLLRSKVPKASWPGVCSFLTQLSALGLVEVRGEAVQAAPRPRGKKRRRLS